MTLHLVSLPHTQTTREWDFCAYTAKVRRFASFMSDAGERVVLYAGEHNEARCAEHVVVVDDATQAHHFAFDPDWTKGTPGGDWSTWWEPTAPWWVEMNARAIAEISQRIEPGDVVLAIAGRCQELLARAFPKHRCIEWGIGYEGVFAPYRVWESYAWMHMVLGIRHEGDGSPDDAVIANSFDPEDYEVGLDRGGYFLYLGRVATRKGVELAVQATRELGAPLVVAGPCVREHSRGRIVADEVTLQGEHIDYVGVVTGERKAKLLAGATALFCPTRYVEPFGGVAIEAMMSGTPVLASDWGAFTETVQEGINGFRCHDLAGLVAGAERVGELDRAQLAADARHRYSTKRAAEDYGAYFDRIAKESPCPS